MRLELEQNHTHLGYAGEVAGEVAGTDRTAEAANHLRDGIRAAQSGNRAAARTSLLRAAELDPQSESAWMWLSSISEYPEELLAFLTNVLEINPRNARALEWSAATKALLAKNLVQRGIDAAESGQPDLAVQLFNQALEHDEKNSMAWLWLASLCESVEGKLSYLEKVLEFEPENETAKAGYQAARNSIREGLLAEARAAAVNGDSRSANELLDAVIAEEPDAEDAWVLKSHIAVGFAEKIAAFRRVLEINPENNVARAGIESLTAIMDSVGLNPQPSAESAVAEPAPDAESLSFNPDPVEEFAEPADDEIAAADSFTFGPSETSSPEENSSLSSSPFDSYADEPVVDMRGTMLMTTSDFDFPLENVTEVSEEPFENEPAEDLAAEAFTEQSVEEQQQAEPAFSLEAPDFTDEQPAPAEPEEITYELAEEAPNTEFVTPFAEEDQFDNPDLTSPAQTQDLPEIETVTWFALEEADDSTEAAISAPTVNPFDSEEFRNERSPYDTVLAVDVEHHVSEAVDVPQQANGFGEATFFDLPFDAARYTGTIPMPESDLETAPEEPSGYETRLVVQPEPEMPAAAAACPFCSTENDAQAIACNSCLAVLTLADLELILANHHADKALLRRAVADMEAQKEVRPLAESELTMLAIGHLNLRNLQEGYNYLHEAAQQNPNNVVLSSQANALLIRLEEIRQQAEAHDAMVKGKTILVVDDSPTVRKLIAGKLEKSGHDVYCCGDGVEAMDRLSTLKPDLILLDITMPRMDGYQVCKLIRGGEATRDTPVVMISGKDGFFDKVRGRMAGCSGYITKPFGPETLMKAVESYLNPEA